MIVEPYVVIAFCRNRSIQKPNPMVSRSNRINDLKTKQKTLKYKKETKKPIKNCEKTMKTYENFETHQKKMTGNVQSTKIPPSRYTAFSLPPSVYSAKRDRNEKQKQAAKLGLFEALFGGFPMWLWVNTGIRGYLKNPTLGKRKNRQGLLCLEVF